MPGSHLAASLLRKPRLKMGRRGVLCYDRECRWCRRFVALCQVTLRRNGFAVAPLQADWVRRRLALTAIPDEMKLILSDGRVVGGAEAAVVLAASIPWSRPLAQGSRLSPVMALLDHSYRWVAAHRGCSPEACRLHGA
jgi:predicted DCC family thiol-disulfide oxidoreductase YuxK